MEQNENIEEAKKRIFKKLIDKERELEIVQNALTNSNLDLKKKGKKIENLEGELQIYKIRIEKYDEELKNYKKQIENYKKEVKTLQEAFELLLSDWVEELEKRGKSQEEILAQRRVFEKIIYWKQDKDY